MIGSTVSHYRVLERLGGGGMGVVYKVWDLTLERFAALKVLNAERDASDDYKRRFIREARTASILDHPNICTIYEAGESAEGQTFIAMAFCAGESLRSRLRRGPLALEDALDIAAQVAAGLDRAHEKGVVHRDIKPANVMLTGEGRRAVIVDFGIARLGDQSRLTRAGGVMGTTSYISPERLLGDAADARADIWSLGVALYEMVTGSLPFRGADNPAVVSAILRRDAAPMSTLRPGIPAELDRIVARALARRPADRYQRAGELCADLRAAAAAGILPAEPIEETVVESPSSAGRERPLSGVRVPGSASGGGRARGSGNGAGNRDGRAAGAGSREEPAGGAGLIGSTVSHYRVLRVLGGGGMGIVYRAEDTQLGRPVALKFLPPELTRDPDAKARFLQEARAASALDHPNICTIHEVGETADGQLFLAMACYDGETLKKRLERGPLPIEAVIDLSLQIARGLAKAHRQGIVHRDVKPANLMVTSDDIVKILDFGIAKLAGAAAITRAGSSLGTPGYMSPEQAHGGEVDARTDLWSLGAVAYEMTTGRRPFRGDHEQAVLYALFHEDPEPLTRLRPEAPLELERIVGGLLAKEPQQRYQTAAAVVADLKALLGPATGTHPGTHQSTPGASQSIPGASQSTPGASQSTAGAFYSTSGRGSGPLARSLPTSRRRRSAAAAAIAAALAAMAGYVLLRSGAGKAVSTAATGAPIRATFTQLTDFAGRESFPSLSPDGNFFLYSKTTAGKSSIFLQRVGGGNPIDLTRDSTQSDSQPAFSPDGQQIAFRSERDGGGIYVMGATGESVRRVTDFGYNPAWSPDGAEVLCASEGVSDPAIRSSASQIWRINLATGARRLVAEGDAVQPTWSPHGQRIAYWGISPGSARRTLWTIPADRGGSVAAGEAVPLVDDLHLNWSPVWAPDGKYLYFASDRSGSMNLWRVEIEEATGKALGDPEPLATPSRWSGLLSISKDGRKILYATRDGKSNLEKAGFDPAAGRVTGARQALTQGSRYVRSCAASPDGQWIAFHFQVPQEDLFVVRPDGSDLRQLTNDPFKDRDPRWSPDGSRIVFYSNRSGRYELWTIHPDGSGLQQVTRTTGPSPICPLWSPDGRKLACILGFGGTALVDLARSLEARVPVAITVADHRPEPFDATSWSPDGRRLAGNFDRPNGSLVPGIVLYSFQSASFSPLTKGGLAPVWLHDSRRLLYRDAGKIFLLDSQSREARLLLEPPASSAFFTMSTSPDDRTLYVALETDEGHIWMLTTT